MEQLTLPAAPTSPLAKVPYVGQERYDGLPFLEYAKRKGKTTIEAPPKDGTYVPIQSTDRRFPPVASEQEPFFQTWLFFGLLSEFFQGNVAEESIAAQGLPNETLDMLYTRFIFEEDGRKYVTTASFLPHVEAMLALAEPKPEGDELEKLKLRLHHLSLCIRYASSVLMSASEGFNPDVRLSIAAMGESLMWIVVSCMQELQMELNAFCLWGRGSFSPQMRKEMIQHGWCPSDVYKCANSFNSVQAVHLVSKIDRSQPTRNHFNCTEQTCKAGQINMKEYHVGHASLGCKCELLTIDSNVFIEILKQKDVVPVLRIHGGEEQLGDLKIDVVESAANARYVAISHVWVDGLGNPFANSLYRCQLARLRDLVKAIPAGCYPEQVEGSTVIENKGVLLWLDTLCCPIGPPSAKNMALEKIRYVYERAAIVLVLDASLRFYSVGPMTVFEAFARIITCGWTRRLWTLQEGALAERILFQFADSCVLLDLLRVELSKKYESHICHRGLVLDLKAEIDLLRSFFHSEKYGGIPADFRTTDSALKHRSVSVASDEALCIGTLMSLELPAILAVPVEERMRSVWEQMVTSNQGIPSAIIFFTEPRLNFPGLKWAPTTLLGFSKGLMDPISRYGNWKSPRSDYIASLGLKVRFPGFRIRPQVYNDGLPHDPWLGSLKRKDGRIARPEESFYYFRNEKDQWFSFFKQETQTNGRLTTTAEERLWKPDMEHPLYDICHTSQCALLLRRLPCSQHDHMQASTDGLIVSYRASPSPPPSLPPPPSSRETPSSPPLHVRAEGHISVARCKPPTIHLIGTIERIATHLRGSELTRQLCATPDKQGQEYNSLMDQLKVEMRRLMQEELDADPYLVQAVNTQAVDFLRDVWKWIANWYRQDVFLAEELGEEQVWVVD